MGINIDTSQLKSQQLWIPNQFNVPVGTGTSHPFGFTAAQMMDAFVNAKNFAVTSSSFGGGTTTPDLTIQQFPLTTMFDVLAAIYDGAIGSQNYAFSSGTASMTFQMFTGGTAPLLLHTDGLFYAPVVIQTQDGGDESDSVDHGMGTCGSFTMMGVSVDAYISAGSPAGVSVNIDVNDRLP